jgi:hypothetical protein
MPFSFWFLTCAQIVHARALTGYTKTQSAKQAAERGSLNGAWFLSGKNWLCCAPVKTGME